ncbi:MAG TPA: ABC transporter substrate-binding protein [Methylomirabilota bacterium]|nr:ABC transporter substrate-binding protein [Methylomirabilota bacterium]
MSVGRGIGRVWLTAAGLLVATATAALAGSPTEQVRQYTDHVQRILHDTSLPQADKRAAVSKIAHEVFDLTETARRALGRHWQGRTPAQQAEFVQLFADLLERTYVAKVDYYGGEQVHFTAETVDGDYAVVRGKVVTRQRTEIPVEARLHQRDGRWLIYDVIIESVSLVGNYRSQFDRIIRSGSYEELVRRLKTRRDEFVPVKERRPTRS